MPNTTSSQQQTYHRVASSEQQDDENNNLQHSSIRNSRSIAERWIDKVWAAAWVTVAVLVGHWSRVWFVLTNSESHAHKGLLQLAAVCVGINCVLFFYLTVYLPYFKGLTDASAWEVYCPRVIPTATVVGCLCTLLLIRATWPVWGFLAPLVLGIEGMGFLFSLHFVPWPF